MKRFPTAVRGSTGMPAFRGGVAFCVLLVAACAGNGAGLDSNGRPLVPGGTQPPPLAANFESIQANIFTPICTVCHAGGSAPVGLRLDAAASYNLLVGVPSTEVPALLRVKPGDPSNSYLIQKLEGHAAVGAQMPYGCPNTQPCLTASTIAFIRQWITDGAPPAVAVAAAGVAAAGLNGSMAVTAIVPGSMESLSAPPPQIMIAFNHELDVSQLATHTVHLERVVAGTMPAGIERVPARLSVSSANLRALMIWPSYPLSAGHYRVVLDAGSSADFSDVAGRTIALGTAGENGETVISTFDVEVTQ
jgi:hypothetical protein